MTPADTPPLTYAVVTPMKDEADYVEHTLRSMAAQTVPPVRWVIVDDGSTDGTQDVVARYEREHAWIETVAARKEGRRLTGSAEVIAFNRGLTSLEGVPYDLVVKLDADVDLPPDYFETIVGEFAADAALGIASGVYAERDGDEWHVVQMPPYHAAGASKVVRRECFEQIHGFIEEPGWDTIDEIRAMPLGWRTCHFPDLVFHHLRSEGSGMGMLKTGVMHGEIYQRSGGGLLFFAAKVLGRVVRGRPFLLNGMSLLYGYLRALWRRCPKLVTRVEAQHYRALLNRRMTDRLLGGSRRSGVGAAARGAGQHEDAAGHDARSVDSAGRPERKEP